MNPLGLHSFGQLLQGVTLVGTLANLVLLVLRVQTRFWYVRCRYAVALLNWLRLWELLPAFLVSMALSTLGVVVCFRVGSRLVAIVHTPLTNSQGFRRCTSGVQTLLCGAYLAQVTCVSSMVLSPCGASPCLTSLAHHGPLLVSVALLVQTRLRCEQTWPCVVSRRGLVVGADGALRSEPSLAQVT